MDWIFGGGDKPPDSSSLTRPARTTLWSSGAGRKGVAGRGVWPGAAGSDLDEYRRAGERPANLQKIARLVGPEAIAAKEWRSRGVVSGGQTNGETGKSS